MTLSPPVAVAAIAPGPRSLTWIASANVITDWLARARTIGAARRIKRGAGRPRTRPRTMWRAARSCKDLRVAKAPQEILSLVGHQVRSLESGQDLLSQGRITKLDLVHYYLAVADGVLRVSHDGRRS